MANHRMATCRTPQSRDNLARFGEGCRKIGVEEHNLLDTALLEKGRDRKHLLYNLMDILRLHMVEVGGQSQFKARSLACVLGIAGAKEPQ